MKRNRSTVVKRLRGLFGIRFVRASCLSCAFGSVLTVSSTSAQDQPIVKLSDWEQAGNGTGMRFVALSTLTQNDAGQLQLPDQTKGGLFQYRVNHSDVSWSDDCRCFRYYIITVRSTRTGTVTRHKFKALPSGSFEDQYANVTLTISESHQADTDAIALPVGSALGLQPESIHLSMAHSLESVVLAEDTELQLTIRNSGNMDGVIPRLSVTPDRTDLWPAVVIDHVGQKRTNAWHAPRCARFREVAGPFVSAATGKEGAGI